MVRPDRDTRAAWADLAARYRWLYGASLQGRLATQRYDVGDWYWIGGQLELPRSAPVPPPARRQRDLTAGPHTPVWLSEGSRRRKPPAAAPSVAEPENDGEASPPGSPLSGRPRQVREIILRTSVQTGVSVARIMGGKRRWADVQARRLCARRLAAMPWCGAHASHQQIGQWLGLDRTSVLAALKDRA
jgi:hypothetical protein